MKIVIIGSGNLATNISFALKNAGIVPCQVFSKTLEHAKELADKFGCQFTDKTEDVITDADVFLIAVKDDAIEGVVESLAKGREEAVFLHTAGSVSIDVIKKYTNNAGVLYPMQSFTKGIAVNFKEIPCFIEAVNQYTKDVVTRIANSVSDRVVEINSDQRKKMHLAAVFASNLTNHCYRLAERITEAEHLDFSLFGPLIMETAKKATHISPRLAQTGPMVRNDQEVMKRQMELIDSPLTKEIYQLMAKSILQDSSAQ